VKVKETPKAVVKQEEVKQIVKKEVEFKKYTPRQNI
jgi:hypothetical protein